MIIERVTEIPRRNSFTKSTFSEIIRRLNAIMDAETKYGKLLFDEGEYVSIYSMRGALKCAADNHNYPLRFEFRNGELYFTRLDM